MKKNLTIKTEWNLKLLYKSLNDPQLKRDIEKIKRGLEAFAKKYKKRTDYLKSDKALLKALGEYEKLSCMSLASPSLFLWLNKELNSNDKKAHALLTKVDNELIEAHNKVLFFFLRIGKLDKKQQARFLKSKILEPYRYLLERAFLESKYTLSEAEEKIMSLKTIPSYQLWVDGVEKVINKQTVRFRGKNVPLSEARNKVSQLPSRERRKLHDDVMDRLKSVGDFAESEINAIVLNKKIGDQLRGYKEPYSSTILGYENDEESIIGLVGTVTDHFKLSHRFYKLKAKLLGLKELHYADRSVSIGKLKTKFPFTKSAQIFYKLLTEIDQPYADMFEAFLKHGQIDVYPKVGKSGGAFCVGSVNNPTYILLNHTDSFNSFSTLAHETGHAIHSEMSKAQPVRYQGYTTSVAETASTLFESLAFERIFERLSEEEKIIALHDKIDGDIATIFRQIAFFNFEIDLHKQIREKGSLAKEEIAALLNTHTKAYLGPIFKLKELDGYFFVTVPHFRNFFYVYSYSYGQLISKVMAARFEADKTYRKEIREFLSAGCSKSPEQIFKDIGIDTTKPSFFKEGLKSVERDITRLEKLVRK